MSPSERVPLLAGFRLPRQLIRNYANGVSFSTDKVSYEMEFSPSTDKEITQTESVC